MDIEGAVTSTFEEILLPEFAKIKDELKDMEGLPLKFTNKRLDDMNSQLADQSRRIDETNKKIDTLREDLTQRIDAVRIDLTQRSDAVRDDFITGIENVNDRLNRLYEVIVRREEHQGIEQKVLELERDVRELKLKIAV
ncbi:MAG: hypothetical protein KAW12_16645 [Candidatus Aminicenantes bacterium]|nr:hypothetical protein [Candidatus Aminicenantes bacterium]